MSSEACTVVHLESAVFKASFNTLAGHLCNLGRYGIALKAGANEQHARLSNEAKILIELTDALQACRELMGLEDNVRR